MTILIVKHNIIVITRPEKIEELEQGNFTCRWEIHERQIA